MKFAKLLALVGVVIIAMCVGCTQKSDSTMPKEWAFEMEKVWEIRQVGEDTLIRPAEPRMGDDGTLYIHDFGRHLSYSIDAGGNLISSFAAQGTNEGEVSFYINCFPAGDYVTICAPDKIHFFTRQGQFVKAVENNLFARFPLAFKDDDEFWVAPGALGDAPDGVATITQVGPASGDEAAVYEFVLADEEKKPSGGAVIVGLTPQVKMGFDRHSDRVFFGKNNDTIIYRIDDGGIDSFSFTATSMPVSEQEKRDHFAKFDIPEDYLTAMMAALPSQMACYNRIQAVDGLVYLFRSDERFGQPLTGQSVEIYSPDGRHLYHGRIQVEEGWHIVTNPDNLQLSGGFVCAVLENDAGDKKIVKYKVALPQL